MKEVSKIFIIILLFAKAAIAQTPDAKSLVREGIDLNNQKNYAGAIEKYKAALALDAGYAPGNYQMAFSLNVTGKGLDGIPYLQKVFTSTTASINLISGAYDLAGSIYDQNHQPQKAIESYQAGIKANPTYQPLQYNLALAYFRNKQYADAEATATGAIGLDPKHASSLRLYALVCFHQNERLQALFGFCEFLIQEPNTARSAEAFGNIQHILQGGALKPEPGQKAVAAVANLAIGQNQIITKALASFAKRRYASASELLTAQLTAVFNASNKMPVEKYLFWYAMNDHLGLLSKTENMPAFARFINQSAPENAKWLKEHQQEMDNLSNWLKSNPPNYH